MEQYYSMKAKHPDALLLYRVGDFYETFGEDAIKASKALGIVLTSRNNGGADIKLAGFPYHSLDAYLPKLIRAGYRVAICEQLEKPSKGKKVVNRGITDVITPGVTTDEKLLDFRKNNFLASVYFANDHYGISLADVSTGEYYLAEGKSEYIQKLLESFSPSEIILPRSLKNKFETDFGESYYTYTLEEWIYQLPFSREKLLKHFKVQTLKGFGVEDQFHGQIAAGAILYYLDSTENKNPAHLTQINRLASEDFVWMDLFTIRNLELLESIHREGKSLIQILDHTFTPMGSRMLRKWLVMPLLDELRINERLDAVASLIKQQEEASVLKEYLHSFGDLERLVSKIPLRRINPREIIHIKNSLAKIKPIKEYLLALSNVFLLKLSEKMQHCATLLENIQIQIKEDAPNQTNKGGIFKDGWHTELDELRYILTNSKDLLLDIQKQEVINTGITNLKIGFNSVFGYFLEVTNKYKNQGLVPDHWIRKQTMSTGERYVTEELKKLETKILGAEERIIQLEEELFHKFVDHLQEYVPTLQHNSNAIAVLDCILSNAIVAQKNNYSKPIIDEGFIIDIKDGRHPVIERQLPVGEEYIANDVYLDDENQQILMITGPNMSGKSALLRQTALICLMAQTGSFVPAKEARLGIIDRLFTRVGASDNISSGESTFMVEMNETASILNNMSSRSLILLDEIGRGTSTYDGISIAWSIAEYLHEQKDRKAKTLFATHYHELNELSKHFSGIKNFHVATQEINNKVLFLRKLVAGGSEHSFGIHVAQMAGMPVQIVQRAEQILVELESNRESLDKKTKVSQITKRTQKEMGLSNQPDDLKKTQEKSILQDLQSVDPNTLSPVECLMKIMEWKKKLSK
ncbi:MAG: DNA mismatch repair protein MutS [Bacteroidota bacterium]|nr:DNA mismatch repair protein MutS [Bacteroidota bacterium]